MPLYAPIWFKIDPVAIFDHCCTALFLELQAHTRAAPAAKRAFSGVPSQSLLHDFTGSRQSPPLAQRYAKTALLKRHFAPC
eukprot:6192431-Pleurochrysis_carterae.AAC.3